MKGERFLSRFRVKRAGKHAAVILLICSPALGVSSTLRTNSKAPHVSAPLRAEQVNVEVRGVAIPFTAFGIIHRLETVPGVAKVQFDLTSGRAVLTLAPNAKITDRILLDAVRDASYTPGRITWGRPNAVIADTPHGAVVHAAGHSSGKTRPSMEDCEITGPSCVSPRFRAGKPANRKAQHSS